VHPTGASAESSRTFNQGSCSEKGLRSGRWCGSTRSGWCRLIGDASAQIQRFTGTHSSVCICRYIFMYVERTLYISKTLAWVSLVCLAFPHDYACEWRCGACWKAGFGRVVGCLGGDKPSGQPANARLETVLINLVTSRAWIMKNVQNANGN